MKHQSSMQTGAESAPPRRRGIPLRSADYGLLGLTALIIGGIYFIYNFFGVTDIGYIPERATRSAFYWIYERWFSDWRETWFAHSHLVPAVCLLLIWLDRRNLRALPRRTDYTGLLVVIASLALHWAGAKSEQTRLTILSLIGLSWGIPFFVCGWPTARRLFYPCALLVFSLPLNFFDAATYPVRIFIAALTGAVLSGLGMDIARVGSAVISNTTGFVMDLADSRTSIFAVTAIIFYSLTIVRLTRGRPAAKALIVLAGIPMLIIANILRGIVVMAAAGLLGESAGTFFYRYLSGPIVVLTAFGSVTAAALFLHRMSGSPPPRLSSPPPGSGGRWKPLAVTLAVITAAAAVIPRTLEVTFLDTSGVHLQIPDQLGRWEGHQVLFCHNREDGASFADPALSPGDACPNCGQPLHEMSAIEKQLLPGDTILKKRLYTHESGRQVYYTVVLSGEKRSSIHRPEVCLVGPNSEIDRSFIHRVDLGKGRTLDVKVLEMVMKVRNPDGTVSVWTTYYAYWFAGIGRETPHHLQRMAWMAADRLFRNLNYRWAYISVTGRRMPDDRSYLDEIDAFLQRAYPHIRNDSP